MDAFMNASPAVQIARSRAVRHRSAPVVMPHILAGHMPDPRTPPRWMQPQAAVPDTREPIVTGQLLKALVVALAMAAVLVAGWSVAAQFDAAVQAPAVRKEAA